MQDLIPLTGNLAVDTAVLSNLGRIDSVPRLGDAGAVRELWFSPPGGCRSARRSARPLWTDACSSHCATRHSLFDPHAAAEFANLYRETLLGR